MDKQNLVMIGNGMAGVRTIEELLKLAPDSYFITIIGAEPHVNYNRILLSPVLAGEQELNDIILNDKDWYETHGIRLLLEHQANHIDRRARLVHCENGVSVPYDRLILATGSLPVILQIPGKDLEQVMTFRDIQDVDRMILAARQYHQAVVIGGGLLGLEAAHGLKLRGMDVTVVHSGPWLMNRQLDRVAGPMLQRALEKKGIRVLVKRRTREIEGYSGQVKAVRFEDGTSIPADLVVMATGITPHDELARKAGIYCDHGIVVNDTMQSFDPRVYAIGECVSHRGQSYGIVAPLFEMAKVCANHLAELGISTYTPSVTSTKLKVSGVDVFSAGDFSGDADTEEIVLNDPFKGIYKKLVIRHDQIAGAVLYGDTTDGSWYFQMLREGRDISDIRDTLMFGRKNLGDAGHQGQKRAFEMDDGMEVCGCNGVCKGTIVKAIKEKGLFTLQDVRKHTKASASCGSCSGLVEQLLFSTLGGDYSQRPALVALCSCTDHTHEEVRQAIREHHLTRMVQVRDFLEWRTPDGCSVCRPALNYYLICAWPHEAKDDPQSRFVNERAHANIQKDGTYSVVPRMYGGVTNADQLRRIADVADKYQVPMVKITGGQRIDLLGISKEDLPRIWADLDMPSGYAYGKALRTVKTCVGSEFCRFGTQDSTRMGIDLEKTFEQMWAPHKVKIAVSGCPRNCAESTIKDVGVIAVESGWEIYIAGNGGIKAEVAQFLVKVRTPEEVLEYTGAFLQLYREQARYLERTVHWIARVGLDFVRTEILGDPKRRHQLYESLIDALRDRTDPWAHLVKHTSGPNQFETISI
ncbi:MAG: nitrite reductase large subunit NirB [Pseudomonadota bacterium]|nr:nitrite reductase large subunit NirB [Pseudomonadota bacterium]